MPRPRGLTHKQKVFVSKYLTHFNARRAARESDFAEDYAGQLMQLPAVKDEIDKRLTEMHMSANEALKLQADIARGDMADFLAISKDGFTIDLEAAREAGLTKLIKRLKKKKTIIDGKRDSREIIIEDIELYPADVAQERILKVHGRLREGDKSPASISVGKFFLPADVVAPSFMDVYRDIGKRAHTEYVLYGGRGSTKSSFIGEEIIYLIKNNPLWHALAMRQVAETLRGSVYARLVWAINILGLADEFKCIAHPMEIEYIPTGQKIYFRGADDPGKLKSITPPFGYIAILWLEELDQFKGAEAVRNIEQSAIRGGDDAFIFKSFNPPPTRNNWANKYLDIPKPTQYQHKSDYLAVPAEWLGKTFLEEAEHLKNVNPKAYEHEYLGLPTNDGGMVFDNVQIRTITDEEIAQFDHILRGQDWGFYPDPASFGKMHYDAARRTLYIFGEFRDWKLSNQELFNALVEKELITKVTYTDESGTELVSYPDLIIADSAEPKSVNDFRAYGANCRGAEKGPESVKYSMKWLQGLTAIVIDQARAPYHAQEFLDYEFERTKDGEIISEFPDKNNHAIDDVRYATNLIWRRKGE